jgi:hypothetical protein
MDFVHKEVGNASTEASEQRRQMMKDDSSSGTKFLSMKLFVATAASVVALALCSLMAVSPANAAVASVASAASPTATRTAPEAYAVYRMYAQPTGEHLFTMDTNEVRDLIWISHSSAVCIIGCGYPIVWESENVGWYAPADGDPVYRLYNPNAGYHFFTKNVKEKNSLVKAGWRYEGIGWHSYDGQESCIPVYRLYNPNAGQHLFTTNANERDSLIKSGWTYEGIAFYGIDSSALTGGHFTLANPLDPPPAIPV